MIIKKATLQNVEALAVLFDQYRVFYNRSSDIPGARNFLSHRMSNNESEIFIAVDATGDVAGFVQLYPIFSSTRMQRLWLLNDLFVTEPFRGKGISVQLIDRAKQLARETHSAGLILETAKSNITGNALYLKTNFSLDEEHNYYSWDTTFN
jgi:GNAT superfamily N-acetyltransferase